MYSDKKAIPHKVHNIILNGVGIIGHREYHRRDLNEKYYIT